MPDLTASQSAHLTIATTSKDAKSTLVRALRRRARWRLALAAVALVGVGGVIYEAKDLIKQAGEIAAREYDSQLMRDVETSVQRSADALKKAADKGISAASGGLAMPLGSAFGGDPKARARATAFKQDMEGLQKSFEGSVRAYAAAQESRRTSAQLITVISGSAIRIIVALFAFFLVQLLASVFRYTLFLSAHYHACADAVEAVGCDDVDALERAIRAMSPGIVGLGRTPKQPLEQVLELLKQASRVTSRGLEPK